MVKIRRNALLNKNQDIHERNIVFAITSFINTMGPWYGFVTCKEHWMTQFATFCFVGIYIMQVIAVFLAKDDKERLFECLSVLCFCGMGLLKLNLLRSEFGRWNNLVKQITSLENQLQHYENTLNLEYESEDEDKGNEFTPYIIRYNNKFKTVSTILPRIYLSTAFIYIVSPFMEYAFRKLFLDETLRYPHILPSWTPLDRISFFTYLPTVICEAVAAYYCVLVHIAFDLTAVGIMIFICGQFYLLRHCSERIGGRGKICNVTKKRDARARFRVKKYHRVHVILINIVKEFKQLIKNIIGVYFFLATFTLCSVAVRFKTESMSKMQLASLVQYVIATLTQLFLLCYFGDAVFNESSVSMGQGPFGAAIWCLSPKVRREVAFLGMFMMKSCSLQAGPFNVLNLPSFIQIVRTAYSCYAVIEPK